MKKVSKPVAKPVAKKPAAKKGVAPKREIIHMPIIGQHVQEIRNLKTEDVAIDGRLDTLEAQVGALNSNTQPNRIKGNNTGSAAVMADLTPTQVTAMLDVMVGSGGSHKKGLVPDPPASAGSKLYLREDATWVDVLALAANMLLGNNTGSTATAAGLTPTQVTAMLDAFVAGVSPLKGLVPAPPSGAGTGKVLSASGWIDSSAAGLVTAGANTLKGNNTGVTAGVADLTPAQVRTLLGLVIGTDVQAWDADLDAIAALATTSFGRSILTLANEAGLTALLGLEVGTDVQAWDADLDAIAALATTSFGRSVLTQANAAALRTLAGVVIGTDVQAWDADLDAIAALATTSFGRSVLTLADAAAARATMGLGSAALQTANTVAETQASEGQLVRGDDPRLVAGGRTFKKLAQLGTAMNGFIAITSDDKLVTWGANNNQTVSRIPAVSDRPRLVTLNGTKTGEWVDCGGSAFNSWGLTSTGELWINGDNTSGQMGQGDVTNSGLRQRQLHKVVVSGRTFSQVLFSNGVDVAACSFWAVMDNGTLRGWGNNANGQLGVGDVAIRNTPTAVTIPAASSGQAVVSLACVGGGTSFMCRTADNKVHGCGFNNVGQLGLGNTTQQTTLQNVSGELATTLLGAGGVDAAANNFGIFQIITPSNTLRSAGYNGNGQLGDNSLTNRSTFVNTSLAATNVDALMQPYGNYLNTGYINTLNELWLVGAAGSGQLGQGNTTQSQVFIKPSGAWQGSVAMALISSFATPVVMVLTSSGTVWLAGASTQGQNGQGSLTAINVFTQIFMPEVIVDIRAIGAYNSTGCALLALGKSGKAYTWGFNTGGLCGQGHLNNMTEAAEVFLI